MPKIQTLKGQKTTGETLLHQLLEEYAGQIESIVAVVHFKDGSMDCLWNEVSNADLSLSSDYLKAQVLLLLMGSERLDC